VCIKKNSMFPFSYIKQFEFDSNLLTKNEKDKIFEAFKIQFDNPKIVANKISFTNFNEFLKRHRWLDEGDLTFNFSENKLTVKLELNFYMFSIIAITFSIGMLLTNYKRIWFSLFGMSAFFLFYTLLYIWTASIFNMTIKNTIRRQLRVLKIKRSQLIIAISDKCPACGESISKEVNNCQYCGILFKNNAP
jgi:hypothetical protein